MKPVLLVTALMLAAGPAFAQPTAAPAPANPKPDTPAVTTQSAPKPATPAAGANSFTMNQAKSRIEAAGYADVTALAKDKDGVWRGKASKAGATHDVSLDYQGNVIGN
jgi:hypothetical protein